jgi:hypothetical protein
MAEGQAEGYPPALLMSSRDLNIGEFENAGSR